MRIVDGIMDWRIQSSTLENIDESAAAAAAAAAAAVRFFIIAYPLYPNG